MNTRSSEFTVRHILVALDASSHSMAALEMAMGLASAAKAELVGLFVEDTRLLSLAGSSQAHEVVYPSAQRQRLDLATMEDRLRAQAEQARRALASLAGPAKVRWSFRVVRGEVGPEVLAAASETDVLALGRTGWSLATHNQLGSTALAAAYHPPRVVLLVKGGRTFKRQVLAIVNHGNLQPTLSVSARLAQVYGRKLVVLVSGARTGLAEEVLHEAVALLSQKSEHLSVHFRQMPGPDFLSIAHAVHAEGGGILVIDEYVCTKETVKQLLHQLDNPMLLVR